MDRSTMTDPTSQLSSPASSVRLSHHYAQIPANAPGVIRRNCISVRLPQKIAPLQDSERGRAFQALVRRYTNQLLYGCQRSYCDTPTCYTARKRLSRGSNASRRLTLLSARIIACNLASQENPLQGLCPGKPVVPTLSSETTGTTSRDSSFREEILDDGEEEKENRNVALEFIRERRKGASGRGFGKREDGEVEVVTDKGLKDPKSFTQQLFNTVAVKMVEWIGLPPPLPSALRFAPEGTELTSGRGSERCPGSLPPSPKEPPKIKFPVPAMDVMDTGRMNRDSEPVSQTRHQEILQRKSGIIVTPTPHSNAKSKMTTPAGGFIMAPPPLPHHQHHNHNHQHRRSVAPQVTPSRGEKHSPSVVESPPETVAAPQSLKTFDLEICTALALMLRNSRASPADKRDVAEFARQSILYVFSTPESALASFGGVGSEGDIAFDPEEVDAGFRQLYEAGWKDAVEHCLWMGIAKVFSKPGKGLGDREAAGMIVLALHALAAGLTQDWDEYQFATACRAKGKVAVGNTVASDIGLDDELAERLLRRTLRAIAYRRERSNEDVVGNLQRYLEKCGRLEEEKMRKEVEENVRNGTSATALQPQYRSGWSLARCTLDWARALFLRVWKGPECMLKDSIEGACLGVLQILYNHPSHHGIDPVYFETPVLGERVDYCIAPVDWFAETANSDKMHLLDQPYLFPLDLRVTFFRAINLDVAKKEYETAITHIRLSSQIASTAELTSAQYQFAISKIETALSIYCIIIVRREHLLEDAINQLLRRERRELLRPMKVRFVDGEEAVDQGGVQQEFCVLLMKEILKPKYGIFQTNERTRMCWFSEATLEGQQILELIGVIIGLAVYNGITLACNFPRALYIKLLGGTPRLQDIDDNWPELARGLKELLEWPDDDVEDIFCRTYDYSYEGIGKVMNVNMIKAKERGIKSLPPPVRKRERQRKKKTAESERSTHENDWLPPVTPVRDPWMGSLNDILDDVMREEEEEHVSTRRNRMGDRRYTVSYTDLVPLEDEVPVVRLDVPDSSQPGESQSKDNEPLKPGTEKEESNGEEPNGEASTTHSPRESSAERSPSDASWETVDREDRSAEDDLVKVKFPREEAEEGSSNGSSTDEFDAASHQATASTGAPSEFYEDANDSHYVTAIATPLPSSAPSSPSAPHTGGASPSLEGLSLHASSSPSRPLLDEPEEEEEEAPLVSNANREAYVEDYISWLTTKSIARSYEPFAKGFFSIISPRALQLFTPSVLQAVVEGSAEIDVTALESVTRYEDGYTADHPTIKDFWSVVRRFSESRKRQLLEFVTSSGRIPVGGIKNLGFWIVRNGPDSERVPTSLTCFGRLLLPEYSSQKKLKEKLKIALENSVGFGTA